MNPTEKENLGIRIHEVRTRKHLTVEDFLKDSTFDRIYLRNVVKAKESPTIEFLQFLHNKHNVNMNYLLGSEGHMFRQGEEPGVKPDFVELIEDVEQMIYCMSRVPVVLYAILGFFCKYKLMHEEFIKKVLAKVEGKRVLICDLEKKEEK